MAGAVVTLVGVGVAACVGAAQKPGTPPFRAAFALPFDAYRLNDEDLVTVTAARTRLRRECMAKKGFVWTGKQSAADAHPLLTENARRYGLADSEAARRYGYHVPDTPQEAQAQAEEAAWAARASKAEQSALLGPGGCLDQADSALWRGVRDRNSAWLVDLEYAAVDQSAADPAVVIATRAWSDCMRDNGFDYQTPQAAVEDRRWNLNVPKVSPAEQAVAAADVRCKQKTDLVAARAAAEWRIQTKMIEQHAKRFEALRKANQSYLGNARHTLDRRADSEAR
ncbi:hypothetical protein [Nonomuraea sp. KM88]|uniref:hypothetical protein n=1 Tax=Nonomuraea sp. KM88 TaxID=3457427 RepID=UPI003FCDDE5D